MGKEKLSTIFRLLNRGRKQKMRKVALLLEMQLGHDLEEHDWGLLCLLYDRSDSKPVLWQTVASTLRKDSLFLQKRWEFLEGHIQDIPAVHGLDWTTKQRQLHEPLLCSLKAMLLSTRSYNALRGLGCRIDDPLTDNRIFLMGELVQKSEDELLLYKNFGRKSLNEIKDALSAKGWELGSKLPENIWHKISAEANLLRISSPR